MFEDGDKQITFSDLYALDLKKLEEWKTIMADDTNTMEWLGSDSEGDMDEESGDEEGSADDESDDSEMETD